MYNEERIFNIHIYSWSKRISTIYFLCQICIRDTDGYKSYKNTIKHEIKLTRESDESDSSDDSSDEYVSVHQQGSC